MIKTLILASAALVVVFWIGLAYWVNKDARRRIRNAFLVVVATLLGLVPFVGPVVYLLFRPAETRDEVRARNTEMAALEAHLGRTNPTCPECSAPVDAAFLVCPVCTTRLREQCTHCLAALEPLWQMCPYCATPFEADLDLDEALTREAQTVPSRERGRTRQPAEI